jgi:hypothetical protein
MIRVDGVRISHASNPDLIKPRPAWARGSLASIP